MTKRKQKRRGYAGPPLPKLTAEQFTVMLARAGRTKLAVRQALRAVLIDGECVYAAAARYEVDRSNLYGKLTRMGLR